MSTNENGKSIG